MNYEDYWYAGLSSTYHGTLGEIRPGVNRWPHLSHDTVMAYGLVCHLPLVDSPPRRGRILHLSAVNELAWAMQQALVAEGYETFFASFVPGAPENYLSLDMPADYIGQGGLQEFRRLLGDLRPSLVLARCLPMQGAPLEEYALTAQLAGSKFVYYLTEQGPEFRSHEPLAMQAPYLLCATRRDFDYYRSKRDRVFFVPFSCLPAFHRAVSPASIYACDALAIGQPFADAARYPAFESRRSSIRGLVWPLLPLCRVHVWGGWADQVDGWRAMVPASMYDMVYRGIFPYREFPTVLSSCKIALGIHSNAPWGGYGGRLAKFLACGAFVLWWYSDGMEEEFENHRHLVWVKSAEEAAQEARYYLTHEKQRRAIAIEGQRYAYEYLDYQNSLMPVLEQIESD